MTTIIEVLNVIIDNQVQLKEIARDPRDSRKVYFRYAGPRVWSVEQRDDDSTVVKVYPLTDDLAELPLERIAKATGLDSSPDSDSILSRMRSTMEYTDLEWNSREAKATFRDLYKTLLERSYNLNNYFDQIVASGGILSSR
jgi:hypothetical protein